MENSDAEQEANRLWDASWQEVHKDQRGVVYNLETKESMTVNMEVWSIIADMVAERNFKANIKAKMADPTWGD